MGPADGADHVEHVARCGWTEEREGLGPTHSLTAGSSGQVTPGPTGSTELISPKLEREKGISSDLEEPTSTLSLSSNG